MYIKEMPAKNFTFSIERCFSKEEMAALEKGHTPAEMEDKWVSFFKEGKLYVGRSWTGTCIYIVSFNNETNIHSVTVNRDPSQYQRTNITEDIRSIHNLLNYWSRH